MIVRPSVHWLRMLFVWRGSILPVILPQLITITLLAIFIYHIHGSILSWKVSLNFVPFSLIGLTLAIFLGFRNSTSYSRFWEARTLWGVLLVESRHLVGQALTLGVSKPQTIELAKRLCAFVYAFKHQLRGSWCWRCPLEPATAMATGTATAMAMGPRRATGTGAPTRPPPLTTIRQAL